MSQLPLNLLHRFLSNLGFWLPWTIRWDIFEFENKYTFSNFSRFMFVFVSMGQICIIWEQNFQNTNSYSCTSISHYFKLLVNFLLNKARKVLKSFHSFSVFVNMVPMGATISKLYSYIKSQCLNYFKLFLKFLPSGPHKGTHNFSCSFSRFH